MSKFKKTTFLFFDALEKEAIKMEKSNPENSLILKRILTLRQQQPLIALVDILKALKERPFLQISTQTMELAEIAIKHAEIWPVPASYFNKR